MLYHQLILAGPLPYFLGGVHKQHCVLIITALVQTSVVASRSTPATCRCPMNGTGPTLHIDVLCLRTRAQIPAMKSR